jgi:DNA invertase Pin-like site-specific DNA recombinase
MEHEWTPQLTSLLNIERGDLPAIWDADFMLGSVQAGVLEDQRATIERFAASESLTVLTEYVEAETGKGSDALDRRPQLAAALAAAKAAKCSVVVAKLYRLSRDVANEGATVSYEIVANRGKESAENFRVG